MIKLHCLFILTVISLFFAGCNDRDKNEEQRLSSWSTEAPLSIPYRVRIQRFEKANLVRNSSFETGRIFALDSTRTSFVIDGWQQVGNHIEWVDIRNNSVYRSDEARSGNKAIKIVRRQAYETDEQGEGILSDYIKVIPGNYAFSFYARLENIQPLKARLGTKIYDAVDIRLLFYNKSKIMIDSKKKFPQLNQYLDNSFKSLSFANYTDIPSFGWGKIIGKTASFPFPEGDIPSDAHYVRIFLGLKGTGTMWIDSVDYAYTIMNFSVAERMNKYTDSAFVFDRAIIPAPRKAEKMESVVFYTPDARINELPVILVPAGADEITLKAADVIREAIKTGIKNEGNNNTKYLDIQIVNDISEKQLEASRLIFSLGNTDLFSRYLKKLPQMEILHHPQGYYIYSANDRPNLIFLGANNSTGLFYASLTAEQLLDGRKPVFHNTRIIDYPDFEGRYFTIEMNADSLAIRQTMLATELLKYKINGAFSCPDLVYPRDSSLCYDFKGQFSPDKFGNITFNICRLQNPANCNFSIHQLLSLNPVLNNEILDYAETQLKASSISTDAVSFYSGNSFFSLNTDDADLDRYFSFSGTKPLFLDNTMLISSAWGQYGGNFPYYPGKVRLYNIFNPFSNTWLRDHLADLDSSMFIVNQTVYSEIDVIRLATAADFMWNAASYEPDYSLWKVLFSRYDSEVARELIDYADKNGLLLEIILKLKLNEQAARNLKNGSVTMNDLDRMIGRISKKLGSNHPLIKDLRAINAGLQEQLNVFITK
jgi:hypothetical protein